MDGAGPCWAYLFPLIGLLTGYTVAHFLKLDPGYSAGLLSGSLTESPIIGTASEAIRALSVPDEQKTLWIAHIAVADAICYIFGTLGVILCCGSIGPKLLGIDLRAESKKLEASLGIQTLTSSGFLPRGNPSVFGRIQFRRMVPPLGKTVGEMREVGRLGLACL